MKDVPLFTDQCLAMIATTTPTYPGASHLSFGTQSITGFHLTIDTAIKRVLTVSKVSVYTARGR